MACSSCSGAVINRAPSARIPINNKTVSTDCVFTAGILTIWYRILKCVKDTNKLSSIGLTEFQANVHLGNIQSAINQVDNYCYFEKELTDFQTNILPRIIENVPNCL